MRSTRRDRLLTRVGLVGAVCGLLFFLNGIGTALHFMYGQSHPVAPGVAFSLEIEHTVGGALLLVAGCGLAVRNWLQ